MSSQYNQSCPHDAFVDSIFMFSAKTKRAEKIRSVGT